MGVIRMSAGAACRGRTAAIRLRVVLENRTEPPGPPGPPVGRPCPNALIAAHCLIAAAPGGAVSCP